MKISTADEKIVDKYLKSVLRTFNKGKFTRKEAQADLAHAILAAAGGDGAKFKAYMRLSGKKRRKTRDA